MSRSLLHLRLPKKRANLHPHHHRRPLSHLNLLHLLYLLNHRYGLRTSSREPRRLFQRKARNANMTRRMVRWRKERNQDRGAEGRKAPERLQANIAVHGATMRTTTGIGPGEMTTGDTRRTVEVTIRASTTATTTTGATDRQAIGIEIDGTGTGMACIAPRAEGTDRIDPTMKITTQAALANVTPVGMTTMATTVGMRGEGRDTESGQLHQNKGDIGRGLGKARGADEDLAVGKERMSKTRGGEAPAILQMAHTVYESGDHRSTTPRKQTFTKSQARRSIRRENSSAAQRPTPEPTIHLSTGRHRTTKFFKLISLQRDEVPRGKYSHSTKRSPHPSSFPKFPKRPPTRGPLTTSRAILQKITSRVLSRIRSQMRPRPMRLEDSPSSAHRHWTTTT